MEFLPESGEAAALGVFGALLASAVHRKLSLAVLTDAGMKTLRLTALIMWNLFAAHAFSTVILPVVQAYGWDPIWFGVIFIIMMEIGYMTPPFCFNLFHLKAVAPPEITMSDIYCSVIPYVLVTVVGVLSSSPSRRSRSTSRTCSSA